MSRVSVVGVPSSAGSYAAGQDQAPEALRAAGLIDAHVAAGLRNSGPTLEQLAVALQVAARDPRFRSLSIGELNPTRSAGDPEEILRFVRVLAATLSARGER